MTLSHGTPTKSVSQPVSLVDTLAGFSAVKTLQRKWRNRRVTIAKPLYQKRTHQKMKRAENTKAVCVLNQSKGAESELRYNKLLRSICSFEVVNYFENNPVKLSEPLMDSFYCVCLWVDICKFTTLGEKLKEKHPRQGGDALTQHLTKCFEILVKEVEKHNGDVVKFCGDALLCQFRCKNKDDEIQLDAHISATKCALKMQEAFSSKLEKEKDQNLPNHTGLEIKISITVGRVYTMFVGGVNDRWEHVLIGEPFQQLSTCNDMCSAGMIVLSKRSFDIMKDHNNKISGRVLHRDSRRNKENRNPSSTFHSTISPILPVTRQSEASGKADFKPVINRQAVLDNGIMTLSPRNASKNDRIAVPPLLRIKSIDTSLEDIEDSCVDDGSIVSDESVEAHVPEKTTSLTPTKYLYRTQSHFNFSNKGTSKVARNGSRKSMLRKRGSLHSIQKELTRQMYSATPLLEKGKENLPIENFKAPVKQEEPEDFCFELENGSEIITLYNPVGDMLKPYKSKAIKKRENVEVVNECLSTFVPCSIRNQLKQCSKSTLHQISLHLSLAEVREVSVLFIQLHNFNKLFNSIAKNHKVQKKQSRFLVHDLHSAMRIIQHEVYNYGGMLRQLTCDDKGTVAICVFGATTPAITRSMIANSSLDLKKEDGFDELSKTDKAKENPSCIYDCSPSMLKYRLSNIKNIMTRCSICHISISAKVRFWACSCGETYCLECATNVLPKMKQNLKKNTHINEDDIPAHAALCAININTKLMERIHCQSSIGVATGFAYCGIVGGESRCDYSVVGDAVNTSARLMCKAEQLIQENKGNKEFNSVLCDENTKTKAQRSNVVKFIQIKKQLNLKGKRGNVTVYSPRVPLTPVNWERNVDIETHDDDVVEFFSSDSKSGMSHFLDKSVTEKTKRPVGLSDDFQATSLDIVGQSKTRNIIDSLLDRLEKPVKEFDMLYLRGNRGSGKSALLSYACKEASKRSIKVIHLSTSAFHGQNEVIVSRLRQLFLHIFPAEDIHQGGKVSAKYVQRLVSHLKKFPCFSETLSHLEVFSHVFPEISFELYESKKDFHEKKDLNFSILSKSEKDSLLGLIFVCLLKVQFDRALIVIDDAHRWTSAELDFVFFIASSISRCKSTRTFDTSDDSEYLTEYGVEITTLESDADTGNMSFYTEGRENNEDYSFKSAESAMSQKSFEPNSPNKPVEEKPRVGNFGESNVAAKSASAIPFSVKNTLEQLQLNLDSDMFLCTASILLTVDDSVDIDSSHELKKVDRFSITTWETLKHIKHQNVNVFDIPQLDFKETMKLLQSTAADSFNNENPIPIKEVCHDVWAISGGNPLKIVDIGKQLQAYQNNSKRAPENNSNACSNGKLKEKQLQGIIEYITNALDSSLPSKGLECKNASNQNKNETQFTFNSFIFVQDHVLKYKRRSSETSFALPPFLQLWANNQIRLLSNEEREVLKMASIVGAPFEANLICHLCDHLEKPFVLKVLESLSSEKTPSVYANETKPIKVLEVISTTPVLKLSIVQPAISAMIINTIPNSVRGKLHKLIAEYYAHKSEIEILSIEDRTNCVEAALYHYSLSNNSTQISALPHFLRIFEEEGSTASSFEEDILLWLAGIALRHCLQNSYCFQRNFFEESNIRQNFKLALLIFIKLGQLQYKEHQFMESALTMLRAFEWIGCCMRESAFELTFISELLCDLRNRKVIDGMKSAYAGKEKVKLSQVNVSCKDTQVANSNSKPEPFVEGLPALYSCMLDIQTRPDVNVLLRQCLIAYAENL